ncbi:MAG: hypothetical protein H6726_12655 [Sandaracinaceae bacterium]|nr:hypothetical protein [Sandaracinaceae bacterium]
MATPSTRSDPESDPPAPARERSVRVASEDVTRDETESGVPDRASSVPEVFAPSDSPGAPLRARWRGGEWSLDPFIAGDALPVGASPLRVPLVVSEHADRLLVVLRCARAAAERCRTWVGVFGLDHTLVFRVWTSDQLPLVSASAAGVAIDTGGEVELRTWTGEVRERFSLGTWTTAARLLDDGSYVWSDGVALHLRDASGQERFRVEGARVLSARGDHIVAATSYDVRVLDATSLALRCRRMALGGALPPEFATAEAQVAHVCQQLPSRAGRVRGALRVDGRALANVRVRVGDQLVVTDRAGWFRAEFDALGEVVVAVDGASLGQRCIFDTPVFVELAPDGREVSVLLDVTTRPRECRAGCGRDCE